MQLSSAAEPVITGAGATFPAPLYDRWAADYERQTGVKISYQALGSGAGIELIKKTLVDFGATDAPLSENETEQAHVVQFPVVIGGVVPVVNITGLRSDALKLSGDVLADIYLGKIKRWNDPSIQALNPDTKLPNANITVVHRQEASGTTYLWTHYLAKTSQEWKSTIGESMQPAWPVGVDGLGNEGVASYVQRTRASIGYVEYAYAKQHHLSCIAVRNDAGMFVKPSAESFAAAARDGSNRVSDTDTLLNHQQGATDWPITGASFILLRRQSDAAERTLAVMKFFDWAFKHGGDTAKRLDYVPVPSSSFERTEQIWREVKDVSGNPLWRSVTNP